MASLSNDTGASCVIQVSLSQDTGTCQQALIGYAVDVLLEALQGFLWRPARLHGSTKNRRT